MSGLPATVDIPLSTDAYGAIRVSGTRVLLDVIIVAFQASATPETIVQQFPSVALLSQRQIEAARLQYAIETRFNPVGIRARLLARRRGAR
jgi:uncharacterized protein (DUF433 family)